MASRIIFFFKEELAFASAFVTSAFCLLPFAFPSPLLGQTAPGQAAPEVVTAVRIQGNQIASDAEVIALAGVTIGMPVTPSLFADVTKYGPSSRRNSTQCRCSSALRPSATRPKSSS